MTDDVIDLGVARREREDKRDAAELLSSLQSSSARLAGLARDPAAERAISADRIDRGDVLAMAALWHYARICFLEADLLRSAIKCRTGVDVSTDVRSLTGGDR